MSGLNLIELQTKLTGIKQAMQTNDMIVIASAIGLVDDCRVICQSLLSKISPITDELPRFKFHRESGHGWLAVKRSQIDKLDIARKISRFSYQKGDTTYLEEDMDMTTFINAFKTMNGYDPIIIEQPSVNRSMIRSYESFYA